MDISLPAELEQFIQTQLDRGSYQSASEVIGDGLRLLQEKKIFQQIKIDKLREEIQKGIDQINNGEYSVYDSESLDILITEIKDNDQEKIAKIEDSE